MLLLQLEGTPRWVQELFSSEFAFLILFILCILEGLMMLRFMPSELVVPSAIVLIGSSIPEVVVIIMIAIAGTTIGQVTLFFIIRRVGKEFIIKTRWVPVGKDKFNKLDVWFDHWGAIAIPISNTMLFIRGLLTFPAGFSDLSWQRFALLSALGTASFQTILAGIYLSTDQVLV